MRRDANLYQIRSGPGCKAGDIVIDLTHAAWTALVGAPGGAALDPHRWASLHQLFLNALKGRLVRYAGCGEMEECRICLKSAANGTPFPAEEWSGGTPVFTLEVGRRLDRFIRLLAWLACRYFRPSARKELTARMTEALEGIFEGRTYLSEACEGCSARKGLREQRLWPEAAKRSVS